MARTRRGRGPSSSSDESEDDYRHRKPVRTVQIEEIQVHWAGIGRLLLGLVCVCVRVCVRITRPTSRPRPASAIA